MFSITCWILSLFNSWQRAISCLICKIDHSCSKSSKWREWFINLQQGIPYTASKDMPMRHFQTLLRTNWNAHFLKRITQNNVPVVQIKIIPVKLLQPLLLAELKLCVGLCMQSVYISVTQWATNYYIVAIFHEESTSMHSSLLGHNLHLISFKYMWATLIWQSTFAHLVRETWFSNLNTESK